MTAVTIHATKPLASSLLATLKRANIELRPVNSSVHEDFNHLHRLTADEEEQVFKEATRANQKRFWERNRHLL